MEQKQLHIQKLSKFSYTLLKCVRILMYIGIAVLLGVFLAITIYKTDSSTLLSNGPPLPFTISMGDDTSIYTIAAKVVEYITLLVLLSMALYYAGKVFKETRTGNSPFVEANIKNLKRTAMFMVFSALLPAIAGIATAATLGANYEGAMNITLLVCALVLLWLAYVFDYGCALQLESDETL